MEMTNKRPFAADGTGDASRRAGWCSGLPLFVEAGALLREPEIADAEALFENLATADVARFIPAVPESVEQFERLLHTYRRQRQDGSAFSYAVVAPGDAGAVGLFHVRGREAGFATAEWSVALAAHCWGSGLFERCANRVLDFAFDKVGVRRLEARAVVVDGRGNGALGKIGAVQEGVLRRAFLRHGQYHDQVLWSLLAEDWQRRRSLLRPRVH